MSQADEVDVEILRQLKVMDCNHEPDHKLNEEYLYTQSCCNRNNDTGCGCCNRNNDARTKSNGKDKGTKDPLLKFSTVCHH